MVVNPRFAISINFLESSQIRLYARVIRPNHCKTLYFSNKKLFYNFLDQESAVKLRSIYNFRAIDERLSCQDCGQGVHTTGTVSAQTLTVICINEVDLGE